MTTLITRTKDYTFKNGMLCRKFINYGISLELLRLAYS